MTSWLSLWLAAISIEALCYLNLTKKTMRSRWLRRGLLLALGCMFIVITFHLLIIDFWLFLLPSLFLPYQLINLFRAIRFRLQPIRLRSSSLETLCWLSILQIGSFGLSYVITRWLPLTDFVRISALLQAITAVALCASTIQMWRHMKPQLEPTPLADSELPTLSVLVPARNETIDLQNCLSAIVASDYPKLEIIALDDNSSDRRTPEIIRGFAHQGVRFVQGREPEGAMLAKNHAYNRLLKESSGELVLFCGVDVLVEPTTLRRLVETLLTEKKTMLSVLPMRPTNEKRRISFIQAMRYWWELGFPRRIFNRPPVLSTAWLIKRQSLLDAGGFKAAAQMITPEAYFAKEMIKNDGYGFIRATPRVPLFSTKGLDEQFATMVRVRYPQLHRRLSLVAVVTLFEWLFLIGPFLLLPFSIFTTDVWLFGCSFTAVVALSVMYHIIAVKTRLSNWYFGGISVPVTFVLDSILMHLSMYRYEFGEVIWHDRSVSRPMLIVIPKLPET